MTPSDSLTPDQPRVVSLDEALHMAVQYQRAGQTEEAAGLYRMILEKDPRNAVANHLLGVITFQAGDAQGADGLLRRALATNPDYAEAHGNFGAVLVGLGWRDEAERHYLRALELGPEVADVWNNLGSLRAESGRSEEAERHYRRAIDLMPDFAGAHRNLGTLLAEAGRGDEAAESFRCVLVLEPGDALATNNLGTLEAQRGNLDESERHYRRAIELDPGYAKAHHNLGLLLLLLGRLKEGFAESEWRWQNPEYKGVGRVLPGDPWSGGDLAGQRILVFPEQGLGDTVQFVRYLPMLAERGCEVVLECQRPLVPLLSGFSGTTDVFGNGLAEGTIHGHVSLMSLPRWFATTLDTVPAPVPYLHADPGRMARWRERLGGGGEIRVGLCWQGSATYRPDRDRSLDLAQFEPLLRVPGVRFFGLQMGPAREQIGAFPVEDLTAEFEAGVGSFVEDLAVMANLDLVICVDTALAHVAGAAGRPVWVLLAAVPNWRWLLNRSDNPWYPTARLFRQTRNCDWQSVVTEAAAALTEFSRV